MLDNKYRSNIGEDGKVIRKGWKDLFQAQFAGGLIILLIIGFALFTQYVYPLNAYSISGFLVIIIILTIISYRSDMKRKDK